MLLRQLRSRYLHFLKLKKVKDALKRFQEEGIPQERFLCHLFEGCQICCLTEEEMGLLLKSLLHLCSTIDQRKWSSKGDYSTKGAKVIQTYRGFCSRRGLPKRNLVTRRGTTSLKCNCHASFTFSRDGKLVFRNGHVESCLVDTKLDNDGYVFSAGLSPTKKESIISTVSDLLCDHGTTNAVVRKQIENSLVKSGDTGFGVGKRF